MRDTTVLIQPDIVSPKLPKTLCLTSGVNISEVASCSKIIWSEPKSPGDGNSAKLCLSSRIKFSDKQSKSEWIRVRVSSAWYNAVFGYRPLVYPEMMNPIRVGVGRS